MTLYTPEEFCSLFKIKYSTFIKLIREGKLRAIKIGADFTRFKGTDLLLGGSPCQDLSIAKKDRQGLDGERSGLFFLVLGTYLLWL